MFKLRPIYDALLKAPNFEGKQAILEDCERQLMEWEDGFYEDKRDELFQQIKPFIKCGANDMLWQNADGDYRYLNIAEDTTLYNGTRVVDEVLMTWPGPGLPTIEQVLAAAGGLKS